MSTPTIARASSVCRLTLLGPASRAVNNRPALRFKLASAPEWRMIVLELKIGGERCPDWEYANLCISAIQDLVKLEDGYMSDQVINALKTHMDVVSYEVFSGRHRG
jgi:hypothetical protein